MNVRKPNKNPKHLFGAMEPTAKQNRSEVLSQIIQTNQFNGNPTENINYDVQIDKVANTFSIEFDNVNLINGGIQIRTEEFTYSSLFNKNITKEGVLSPKTLTISDTKEIEGEDGLGKHIDHTINWISVDEKVIIETHIKHYKDPQFLTFQTIFRDGLENTSTDSYEKPCLEFPIFTNKSNRSLLLSYEEGQTSGPLLLYNEDLQTMILSSTMNFLTTINEVQKKSNKISLGLEGCIEYFPEEFIHETILYASTGINNTLEEWGNILLKYYQKEKIPSDGDYILKYLGFWTGPKNNYYDNMGTFENADECFLAVKNFSNLPLKYLHLGDWFYFEDLQNGSLLSWEGKEKYFPTGVQGLVDKLEIPLITNFNTLFSDIFEGNEQWSGWVLEKLPINEGKILPDTPKNEKFHQTLIYPSNKDVWFDLFGWANEWGTACIQLENLNIQWENYEILKNEVYAGEVLMNNLDNAATNNNLTIQLSNTHSRFFMNSLAMKNVTQISYDKAIPNDISAFAWALGIWPWANQDISYNEKINFYVNVLSGGPVGVGNAVNKFTEEYNRFILQACKDDGVLIKPDRPALPIDLMYIKHSKPYTISTFSEIQGARWYYLLLIDKFKGIQERWLNLHELGLTRNYVLYDFEDKSIEFLDAESNILLPSKKEYNYYTLSPVLSNGMACIGLRDKIITVSHQIFTNIMVIGQTLNIAGKYLARTEFTLLIYCPNEPTKVIVNEQETKSYTWGPYFKTLTIEMFGDSEDFTLSIQ